LHLHAPLVGLCVALGMIALVLAGFLSCAPAPPLPGPARPDGGAAGG